MPADTFANILDLYFGGDMEASVGLAGQSVGLINKIKPVKQIIEETVAEFFEITGRMGACAENKNFG